MQKDLTIAVVGLGYVGLPLAIEFGKYFDTIGFDVSKQKIDSYLSFYDPTGEVSKEEFQASKRLRFTNSPSELSQADVIVVAVPTPVNKANQPDFTYLISASTLVGQNMKKGSVVVYESTVYPGATEEICLPILIEKSGYSYPQEFNIGYSPERINPGDKEHTLTKIIKVVSANDEETLKTLSDIYGQIITAGIYPVKSIKVAEAAKVIENTQRDLNIALINELAIIFHKLGIDTAEVLKAAGTKWNFLHFKPGLVGGHCIGVDPYYLTYKAQLLNYHPNVILAGRRINDYMPYYIASEIIKELIKLGCQVNQAKLAILGMTFKENCADIRNSKVADLYRELCSYGCSVVAHDPLAHPDECLKEYGIKLTDWNNIPQVDALVVAVPHREYLSVPIDSILSKLKPKGLFVDIKACFDAYDINFRDYTLWRL